MVIIIMSERESIRDSVGRFLANHLGWEFAEAERLPGMGQAASEADGTALVDTLSAAIHSSPYEWKDEIVSCPILPEAYRKQLSHNNPLAKFVCLKNSDPSFQDLELSPQSDHMRSEAQAHQNAKTDCDENLLTVDCSQSLEQILAAVLSGAILAGRTVRSV